MPAPPQGFGPPPGAKQAARCMQGHAIPPGGSFCMEGGHPIALDGMQIGGGDQFGATNLASGAQMPPTGAMSGFGSEPQQGFAPPPPPPPQAAPPPASAVREAEGNRRTLAGFLVSFQDDAQGKFWPLWQGRNVIGRSETGQTVDIPIGHGTTSTHHAQIECDGGRVTLTDLGSTNGTFHNEEAVGFQGRRELRDGDKVRFGGFSVVLFNVTARF